MPPPAVEKILNYCETRIAGFEQTKNTGQIEIRCCLNQGQCRIECRCGDFRDFLIPLEDLAVWRTTPLSRQREALETIEQVLAILNSALHETFVLQQGYAIIAIWHRGHDRRYGFWFSPSVVHGIKPC
ncbi:MAG: hypothetical protein KME21_23470 [Desmonostoc vinosum HA7617-LM4]|jgi:hypothetical protein|nr:hypothetical protein [Desmonostoc vinosum HA7617-LM4]